MENYKERSLANLEELSMNFKDNFLFFLAIFPIFSIKVEF